MIAAWSRWVGASQTLSCDDHSCRLQYLQCVMENFGRFFSYINAPGLEHEDKTAPGFQEWKIPYRNRSLMGCAIS